MAKTAILVTHDSGDKDDRASSWLRMQGYKLHWTCPAEGEVLPAINDDVAAVVVYGGKYDIRDREQHVFLKDEMRLIEETLERDIPFLGLCLGGQLLAHVLGQDVGPHPRGHAEYGYYELIPNGEGRELFGEGLKVLQSHWHGWYETPKGAVSLASTARFPEQAFRFGRSAYAFQFHPEASRTMLETWIGRRPPERYALPGAFSPERQREDFARYDKPLGDWFNRFLGQWMNSTRLREAAE
jgi:GMP synthase (glutamine-hydrolysing)